MIVEVYIFRKALHFSSARLHSVSSALAVGFVRIDSNKVAEIGALLFPNRYDIVQCNLHGIVGKASDKFLEYIFRKSTTIYDGFFCIH